MTDNEDLVSRLPTTVGSVVRFENVLYEHREKGWEEQESGIPVLVPLIDDDETEIVHDAGSEDGSFSDPSIEVVLFTDSGEAKERELWRIPQCAMGPEDMRLSPDFRRVGDGDILVRTQKPWHREHRF